MSCQAVEKVLICGHRQERSGEAIIPHPSPRKFLTTAIDMISGLSRLQSDNSTGMFKNQGGIGTKGRFTS
jgi:hypothetical protein